MKTILHIDFNSYFATVEQQANPRLRGKPIGVSGGDRTKRTVIGAASIEAKRFGVKTGMQIWEAKKLCPEIILVPGDSDKYLAVTTKFLNILKSYTPHLEVFSIDECFLEFDARGSAAPVSQCASSLFSFTAASRREPSFASPLAPFVDTAREIKSRIRNEIGEWMSVSIGISYNKLMAKLASNLQKPDGLVVIPNEEEAIKVLDTQTLDEICGIGHGIKNHLNRMGVFTFKQLRALSLETLLFEFKSYGYFLYNAARGVDHRQVLPFHEKAEVKSVGHRHTISHDTNDQIEIKQIMLKLTELIARKLREKKLVGKTVSCWFRYSNVILREAPQVRFNRTQNDKKDPSLPFEGASMQITIPYTQDGLDIFNVAWKIFHQIWDGSPIRMVGVSISNLKPQAPQNLTFLADCLKQEKIIHALDLINNKYGEFTLQRGILLKSTKIYRKPNAFLSDRRFKLG